MRNALTLAIVGLTGLALLLAISPLWSGPPAPSPEPPAVLQEGSGSRGYPSYPPLRPSALPVTLVIYLPADAQLEIEGVKTQQSGAVRRFASSPLPLGREYTYTLKATWKEGDKEITRKRTVPVRGGEEAVVDLRREAPAKKKPTDGPKDDKAAKAEEQAKMVSEKFVKAFVMNKDLDAVMKLAAVPSFWGFGEEPKVIRKSDDLKKQFATLLGNEKFKPAKGPLTVHGTRTYEQFLAKEGDKIGAGNRKMLDEVLKKTDWLVDVRVKSGDATTHVTVLVGWRDGQAKVVGYKVAWSQP